MVLNSQVRARQPCAYRSRERRNRTPHNRAGGRSRARDHPRCQRLVRSRRSASQLQLVAVPRALVAQQHPQARCR
ncbi:uncharacterized protein BDV17DRAFT_268823 [Aspergillus undulatus]|uniref:uncharacterized protein n=1 Tax=Aspergillus undulatus TaxID=1810928 RepID=UPI003CCD1DBA